MLLKMYSKKSTRLHLHQKSQWGLPHQIQEVCMGNVYSFPNRKEWTEFVQCSAVFLFVLTIWIVCISCFLFCFVLFLFLFCFFYEFIRKFIDIALYLVRYWIKLLGSTYLIVLLPDFPQNILTFLNLFQFRYVFLFYEWTDWCIMIFFIFFVAL